MGYGLGIDLGTTTVKICLVSETKEQVSSAKLAHDAYQKTTNRIMKTYPSSPRLLREQDPRLFIEALHQCSQKLEIPLSSSSGIDTISVTGQMHGVMLWKEKERKITKSKYEYESEIPFPSTAIENVPVTGVMEKSEGLLSLFSEAVESYSNLITWEDQRCSDEFLHSLPTTSFGPISSGYGNATLLWLHQHDTRYLQSFTMCGTIMDFLVWLLTRGEYVAMTSHNAKSWGYFDDAQMCWEKEKLSSVYFNVSILPVIVPTNQEVGVSSISCYGITKNHTKVYVGLGDMQCSIRSCNPSVNEAVLNIGTSSQISIVVNQNTMEDVRNIKMKYPSLDVVPYMDDDVIITAASLTGGNVLGNFASVLQDWMKELGCNTIPSTNAMLQTFQNTAQNYQRNHMASSQTPVIFPRIFGERHAPNVYGSVSNITSTNMSLGSTANSLCHGMVENLLSMMPKTVLDSFNITRIVVTGGGIVNNKLLQDMVSDVFKLPLRISECNDAANGAVLFER